MSMTSNTLVTSDFISKRARSTGQIQGAKHSLQGHISTMQVLKSIHRYMHTAHLIRWQVCTCADVVVVVVVDDVDDRVFASARRTTFRS